MLYLAAALYTACGVSAGVAAMLAACAYLRRMTTSAVVERLDRQDETLRQVVAELARLRAAVYGRSADEQRLMIAVAAEGYRRGRADGGPDAETLRTIYWNAYTDVLSDLGGSAPAER